MTFFLLVVSGFTIFIVSKEPCTKFHRTIDRNCVKFCTSSIMEHLFERYILVLSLFIYLFIFYVIFSFCMFMTFSWHTYLRCRVLWFIHLSQVLRFESTHLRCGTWFIHLSQVCNFILFYFCFFRNNCEKWLLLLFL